MQQKELNSTKDNVSLWTNAVEASIIISVILVPIVFYPWCITVFVPVKEMIAEVLTILGLMFWGFNIVNREELKFVPTPLNFPILSFISICILSLIWSNSFFTSLKELPLFLAGPLLYFVVTNNINYEHQVNRILNILLIIGGLFGIYGILQYNGIDFPFWIRNVGRLQVFGLFGNVNFFAEYLIVPLPIAVSLFFTCQKKLKKILLLIGILAMGTSLIVTFTRGSYIGFGASLIFMAILFIFSRGKNFIKDNKKNFMVIFAVMIIITFLFVIPTPLSKSGTVISTIKSRISITQLVQSVSVIRRITILKFTALMIKDHPLLGSGIGTYKYNTLRYQAEFFEQEQQNRSLYIIGFANKAHNEYMQIWAELGIIGLGIFIWLMIGYFTYGLRFIKKTKNEYKKGIIIGLMGAVVAVLVDGIFGFPLHLPATVILFWLALALTIVMIKSEVDAEEIDISKKDKSKKMKGEKDNNISWFKPLLYVVIILATLFLCITVARPFIARTHLYYGNKEIKNKDINKAIKIYEKALRWDPYSGQIYYEMGKILKNRQINNLAMEYFEKAEKYIDHPDLPQNLATVYLRKELFDKAAIKLKQAISYEKKEESMFPMYNQLGTIYTRLEKYKQAEMAFKNSLKIYHDFVSAHYGLAGAYLKQNKQTEALEELQKVIELAPNSREAQNARELIQKIAQEKLKVPPTE